MGETLVTIEMPIWFGLMTCFYFLVRFVITLVEIYYSRKLANLEKTRNELLRNYSAD